VDVVVVIAAALYGLVVGSFLNVAVHRVPAGQSVVRPRSACPTCATPISARDNLPLVSWVILRGRCRTCAEPISVRYPAVELLTGLAFVVMALRFGPSWELPAFCILMAGLVAVSAIDLDCRRIPTRILRVTAAAGVPFLLVAAAIDADPWPAVRIVAGAAGAYGVLLVVHLVSPRGMGFGDVRLAGLLGAFLGWLSLGHVPLGLMAGFLYGSVVGVGVLVARRGDRRTALPFGPFLALGAVTAILAGEPLLDLYLG
jgi:leader peptidase (prepilin peptidase)/N-methyltransferase